MSLHKNYKIFLTILLALLIVLICALGIVYLVKTIDVNAVDNESTSNVSTNVIQTVSGNISTISTEIISETNTKVNISITDNTIDFTNIGNNYSYSINTEPNQLILNVSGRNLEENSISLNSNDIILSNISGKMLGEESFQIIVNCSDYFVVEENYDNEDLSLTFTHSNNDGMFIYRNDTTRKFITILKGRISSRDEFNIKNYTEHYSSDKLTYSITIDSSLMPNIVTEKIEYNDDYLKYIDIEVRNGKTTVEFYCKQELIFYQNTRDADATITLIPANKQNKVIVVDPGHGGTDAGAVFEGRLEKEVTLQIAMKTATALEDMGYYVYITREEDIYIGLNERIDIGNLLEADVFLNIHANAYSDDISVKGALVMYKDATELATLVQNNLIANTGAFDMGTRYVESMLITNKAECPAIIIECGFITNTSEWNSLNSSDYQYKLAKGISIGVDEFLKNN